MHALVRPAFKRDSYKGGLNLNQMLQQRKGLGWMVIALAVLAVGCGDRRSETSAQKGEPSPLTEIKYASGFKVSSLGRAKLVEVIYPFQGATSGYTYVLVPRGQTVPAHPEGARVIFTPLESIVCTSTTHIPLLDYLGETEKLAGFPTTEYISSGKMRKRVEAGKVVELGVDNDLNLERLAVLQPDMVMGYTVSSEYGQFRKIESMGIPVVINSEYLETHPLGRAEWIKFMALFFHKEKQADSVFSFIESSYLETMAKLSGVSERPTVLSGIVYGDAWYLPGGQNYAARLFRDAGLRYLWEENERNGFLRLSFETVYATAQDARLWIGTGSYRSLAEIRAADTRYTRFSAFRNNRVYNYDARVTAKGNEYLELGYLRPDLILKDLAKIAHPELLEEHELYFHRQLP